MKDKYSIEIDKDLCKNYSGNESVVFGHVLKNGNKFIKICNKGSGVKNGFAMAITFNGEEMIIHVDKFYRNMIVNHYEIFKPLLFHEVGHYENGDFYNDPIDKELRAALLMQGVVIQQELNADKFSREIVGKKALIKSLNYLLNERNKEKTILFVEAQYARIKEIELRIEALKKS